MLPTSASILLSALIKRLQSLLFLASHFLLTQFSAGRLPQQNASLKRQNHTPTCKIVSRNFIWRSTVQHELPQDGERRTCTWVLALLKNSTSAEDGHAGSDYVSSRKTWGFGHISCKSHSVSSWAPFLILLRFSIWRLFPQFWILGSILSS